MPRRSTAPTPSPAPLGHRWATRRTTQPRLARSPPTSFLSTAPTSTSRIDLRWNQLRGSSALSAYCESFREVAQVGEDGQEVVYKQNYAETHRKCYAEMRQKLGGVYTGGVPPPPPLPPNAVTAHFTKSTAENL